MKPFLVIFLLATTLCGCSTNSNLRSPMDSNRKVISTDAEVVMRSGRLYEARQIEVTDDTTMFICRQTETSIHVMTREIKFIRVTHAYGGTIEGLLLGSLGGIGAGLLAIPVFGNPASRGEQSMGNGLLVLGGLVIGGAGGMIYGTIHGHRNNFIFPADSSIDNHTAQTRIDP